MELSTLYLYIKGDRTHAQAAIRESTADMSRLEAHAKRTMGGAAAASGTFDKANLTSAQNMGRMLPAFALTAGGIGTVTKAISDSIAAYAQEEVGIARLGSLLQANIPNWTGNTTAIEGVIEARQRLGFDDAKLRDSFGILAARTHDVTRGFELQSIALDLARGKHLDLETASTLIGKVYGGNLSLLSRYGIEVSRTATAEEALAQIQKTYAGQSEAYSRTAAGASDRLNTALGNLSETVGGIFSPTVSTSTDLLADWIATIDRGVIKAVELRNTVNEWEGGESGGGGLASRARRFSPQASLSEALDTLNESGKLLVKASGVAGQGWTTELVAAIGAGKISLEDAVKGNLTSMQITEVAKAAGGEIGKGYSLFTADGVAIARKNVEGAVSFNSDILAKGMDVISDYQEKARASLAETLRLSATLDAHDRTSERGTLLGQVGTDAQRKAIDEAAGDAASRDQRFQHAQETAIAQANAAASAIAKASAMPLVSASTKASILSDAEDKARKLAEERNDAIRSVFSTMSAVSAFTESVSGQREDVRGQIRLMFTNADEALRIYTVWSSSWKEANMERAGRIGKNLGDVFSGINPAFQAVLSAQSASLVADYEIDDAVVNMEHMLGRVSQLMDSPVFGGDWARRAGAFSQGAGGLFDTMKKGMDVTAMMGESGSSGYDPSFFMDTSGRGSSGSAGGGPVHNNCVVIYAGSGPGIVLEDADADKLVRKIRANQAMSHGAVIGEIR